MIVRRAARSIDRMHGGHDHVHDGSHVAHSHAPSAHADRRRLSAALALIAGFMAVEIVPGLPAGSLALLSDAAHMLTDAASLAHTTLQVDHESWQPLVQIEPSRLP
jgi:Co/Zn/Cd efflux system component